MLAPASRYQGYTYKKIIIQIQAEAKFLRTREKERIGARGRFLNESGAKFTSFAGNFHLIGVFAHFSWL
jgi:hypothetical protein